MFRKFLKWVALTVASVPLLAVALWFGLPALQSESVTVTDFSSTVVLRYSRGAAIDALHFSGKLEAKGPVTMRVQCNDGPVRELEIPPNQHFEERIDWYTGCAQIAFAPSTSQPTRLRLKYRFSDWSF